MRNLTLLLLGVCTSALAQDVGPASQPPLLGDGLIPSAFNPHAFATEDAAPARRVTARLLTSVADTPFVVRVDGSPLRLLGVSAAVHAAVGAGIGPVRFGASVPFRLVAGDTVDGVRTVAGDAAVDVHVVAVTAKPGRPGVAVLGRVSAPLGGSKWSVGHDGLGWDAGLALDGRAGPAWIGGNVGWHAVPRVQSPGLDWDDGVFVRAASAIDVHPRWNVGVEVVGHVGVLHDVTAAGAPFEGLLSAAYRSEGGLQVRFGVGTALTPGIGASRVRGVVDLSWTTRDEPPGDTPTE